MVESVRDVFQQNLELVPTQLRWFIRQRVRIVSHIDLPLSHRYSRWMAAHPLNLPPKRRVQLDPVRFDFGGFAHEHHLSQRKPAIAYTLVSSKMQSSGFPEKPKTRAQPPRHRRQQKGD